MVKKTRSDPNILTKYLAKSGSVEIEELPALELDHVLSKFFIDVRKADGTNYEPNTISSY